MYVLIPNTYLPQPFKEATYAVDCGPQDSCSLFIYGMYLRGQIIVHSDKYWTQNV